MVRVSRLDLNMGQVVIGTLHCAPVTYNETLNLLSGVEFYNYKLTYIYK